MPVWLVTFLTGLIEPIVKDLINKMMMEARLNSIEKKQQATIDAFQKLNSAGSSDEIKAAAAAISASWNQ